MKNQKKLKLTIGLLLGIFLINLVSASFYYDIGLDYDKGNIKINSVNIEFSNYELDEHANERFFLVYSSKILGKDNVLDEIFFSVPNKQYYDIYDNETDRIIDGGVIELENVSFNINLPYYENAEEIVIYNEENEEIARKSLIEFSKDFSNQDYKNIIAKTGKKISEEDEISEIEKEFDKIEEKTRDYTIPLIIGLLVILVVVIIYAIGKKRK